MSMMLHLFLLKLIVKHMSLTAWKDDFVLTQFILPSVQKDVKTDLSTLIFKVAICGKQSPLNESHKLCMCSCWLLASS